ncbi:MAG: isoprenylcysteine carboxylmethyltransferase family protein [Planctomycetota bacterium]
MATAELERLPRELPPMWFLGGVAAMWSLHTWLPLGSAVPVGWRWLGFVPMIATLPVAFASLSRFRSAGTSIKPFGEVRELVVAWPFTWSRNPMYLALVVLSFGLALRLGSISPLIVPPLLWWILRQRFVRREEAFLRHELGAAYDDYCGRVRRWI